MAMHTTISTQIASTSTPAMFIVCSFQIMRGIEPAHALSSLSAPGGKGHVKTAAAAVKNAYTCRA